MDQTPPSDGYSEPPYRAQIVAEPAPPRRKRGLFGRFLMSLLFLGFLGSVGLNFVLFMAVGLLGISAGDEDARVKEKYYSLNRNGTEKVAVISIEGVITSGEGFFKHQIDHARKDIEEGNLRAIVLRVNSPGGTISGSDYMLHHLRELVADSKRAKIPIVVSMGGVAASGGYYVSMCVGHTPDTIFAEPSTWTGSIGVIIPHYNVADLMEKWGIQEDAVVSHRLKGMGGITRKMTAEERAILQGLVDNGFTQFKDVIKQGRAKFDKDPAALDKLATGQVYTAEQARTLGLVDKIGFIEDAIDQAIKLAGLRRADVKVVKYKEEPRLSQVLFGETSGKTSVDLSTILESATPQAHYLMTWPPTLGNSAK